MGTILLVYLVVYPMAMAAIWAYDEVPGGRW